MPPVLQIVTVVAVVLVAALVYTRFRTMQHEAYEIRKERRTGRTPLDGTPVPEYRIPVTHVRTMEDSAGKMLQMMGKVLNMQRRIYDLLSEKADGRPDDELQ